MKRNEINLVTMETTEVLTNNIVFERNLEAAV